MTDDTGLISVCKITENDDNTTTLDCEADPSTRDELTNLGLKLVLHCAAAGMDTQDVFEWLDSSMIYKNER